MLWKTNHAYELNICKSNVIVSVFCEVFFVQNFECLNVWFKCNTFLFQFQFNVVVCLF